MQGSDSLSSALSFDAVLAIAAVLFELVAGTFVIGVNFMAAISG